MARVEAGSIEKEAAACRHMAGVMRRWIIEQSLASNVGHIGSALSIADIVAVLWHSIMRNPGTEDPARDRFILAKGHAALALYCALRFQGLLSEALFKTYCGDGSKLGAHPEHTLAGVDLSTGSLGLGLSVGCGLAYAFRQKKSPARVYVLASDAECNEGQMWEAAMFAAHHGLSALTVVVDLNGSQALGDTRKIIRIEQRALWQALDWQVCEADGHDARSLIHAFNSGPLTLPSPPWGEGRVRGRRPRVVLATTVLGKGVSFMENRFEWHYRNLTPEQAAQALRELEVEGGK